MKLNTGALVHHAKTDPKFLKRVLANPGLRSKLPDSMLTTAQLKTRQALQAKAGGATAPAPPVDPNAQLAADIGDINTPLSGKSLVDVAKILADRQYNQSLSDIGTAETNTKTDRDRQLAAASSYLSSLQGLAQKQADAAPAVTDADVAREAAIGTAAKSAVDQALAGAQARAAADNAARGDLGGGSDARLADQATAESARLAATNAAAQTRAAELGQAQQAVLQGANVATGQNAAATKSGILQSADRTLAKLGQDRVDAGRKQGEDFVSTLTGMRGTEADRLLTQTSLSNAADKAILDAKVELQKVKTNADLTRWKANLAAELKREGYTTQQAIAEANRTAAQARQDDQQSFTATQNHLSRVAAARRAARGGSDGFTHQQRTKAAESRDNAINAWTSGRLGKKIDPDEAAALRTKYGAAFAQAVQELASAGHVSAKTAKQVQERFGVSIPRKYLKG